MKSIIRDIKTERKVKKHLKDKNDKITEADIKNAKSNFGNAHEKLSKEEEEKVIKGNSSPGIETTWNILEE